MKNKIRTGNKMWQPAVIASGKISAQSTPGICHPIGTMFVVRITIPAQTIRQSANAIQKRFKIFGTSSQKLLRSTSFFVAPHWMLYEKRCARRAWERWIERPPKKKKLWR